MKCARCGKVYDKPISICKDCGYDFDEARVIKKKLKIKQEPLHVSDSDLFDNPIFTFVFGLISLIIPIFVFSILAIKFSKRPAKVNLEPFSNLGKIFGYIGYGVSSIFVIYFLFTFFN